MRSISKLKDGMILKKKKKTDTVIGFLVGYLKEKNKRRHPNNPSHHHIAPALRDAWSPAWGHRRKGACARHEKMLFLVWLCKRLFKGTYTCMHTHTHTRAHWGLADGEFYRWISSNAAVKYLALLLSKALASWPAAACASRMN